VAEEWLHETLHQARRGTLAGQVRTGVTFADAAAERLRTSKKTGVVSRRRSVATGRSSGPICCRRPQDRLVNEAIR
jgi:hypothetical protein